MWDRFKRLFHREKDLPEYEKQLNKLIEIDSEIEYPIKIFKVYQRNCIPVVTILTDGLRKTERVDLVDFIISIYDKKLTTRKDKLREILEEALGRE